MSGPGAPAAALLEASRPLVLDGAYGTMFRALDLPEAAFHPPDLAAPAGALKGNYELLNLSRPDLVKGLHEAYLAAGADIIETNTFNASPLIQAGWGTAGLAQAMARQGAWLARAAADRALAAEPARPRLVAGALGVTRRDPARRGADSPPGLAGFDDDVMHAACRSTAEALIEGGVDLLLIETVTSLANALIALEAASGAMAAHGSSLPVVLCATVDAEGRLETGEAIEALAEGVAGFPLHGLGLNCALNGRAARAPLAALAGRTAARLWLYPNAGYPDRDGRYDETPVETAAALQDLAREGLVDVVGGCCGTTPAHIAALAAALAGLTARHAR